MPMGLGIQLIMLGSNAGNHNLSAVMWAMRSCIPMDDAHARPVILTSLKMESISEECGSIPAADVDDFNSWRINMLKTTWRMDPLGSISESCAQCKSQRTNNRDPGKHIAQRRPQMPA